MTIIIAGLLVALVLWFVLMFNSLVKKRNIVKEGWSGIDVQLKRRYDLIPNLLELVKGYSQYEGSLLEDVTQKRSHCIEANGVQEQGNAENQLTRGIRSLFAIIENYPDLKANKSFLDLQKQLVEVEDQIQYARRYYNGSVRNYNTLIESFPSLIVAKMFQHQPKEFFEIESATERTVRKVDL